MLLAMHRSRPRRPRESRSKPEIPLAKWYIKRFDFVEVNQGPEVGIRGQVLARDWKENTVTVEGVNLKISEELDVEAGNIFAPQWKTKEEPQPIHFSHVSLIDPTTDTRTDVFWRKVQGKMTRLARSTLSGAACVAGPSLLGACDPGALAARAPRRMRSHRPRLRTVCTVIPLPRKPDDPVPEQYAEEFCTRRDDVLEVTFVPLVSKVHSCNIPPLLASPGKELTATPCPPSPPFPAAVLHSTCKASTSVVVVRRGWRAGSGIVAPFSCRCPEATRSRAAPYTYGEPLESNRCTLYVFGCGTHRTDRRGAQPQRGQISHGSGRHS